MKYLKHQNISISTNTIGLYLTYLNNAYILFKAPREDMKTKNILTINEKYYCIQVLESIIDENTRKREFKPLKLIKDNYPKYILTTDDWNYSNNGIIHMNIIDFLLDETI